MVKGSLDLVFLACNETTHRMVGGSKDLESKPVATSHGMVGGFLWPRFLASEKNLTWEGQRTNKSSF